MDNPRLRDFVDGLEPVNALADTSPGFVWRLQTEDGDATAVQGSAGVLTNMSVWTSVRALADFVYSPRHLAVLAQDGDPGWLCPA
ncbi:MAG TPA: DUF3291 domain-containing protein [Amycolatopsis sp.]